MRQLQAFCHGDQVQMRKTERRRAAADQSYYSLKLSSLSWPGKVFSLKREERSGAMCVCVCACDGEMWRLEGGGGSGLS